MNAFSKWILSIIEGDAPAIFDLATPIIESVLADDTIPLNQKFTAIQTRLLAAMESKAIPVIMADVSHIIASGAAKQGVDIITPAVQQIGGNPAGTGPDALKAHGG
jgi:hypothetical protein